MIEHKTRVILITVMLALAVIGLVVMASLGRDEGTTFGALIGLVSALGPAWFDALGVQRRGGLLEAAPVVDVVPPYESGPRGR